MMHLTRLRLHQVRRFRQEFLLDDLQPGLNVICGPNEAGKSTLVRALRALFFERHRSRTVTDLQPWGDSGAAPEIEADFVWQDVPWHLGKRFVHRRRCDLRIGTDTFDGETAEDRVAELLGYHYASRGSSRAEHWGVPGLLWVDQGSGQELRDAALHAAPHLRAALGGDLAALSGGSGDAVLAHIEHERSQLLTRTGRPTGDYARLLTEQSDDDTRLQDLRLRSRRHRHDVDRLAQWRQQHQAERLDPPWQAMQQELAVVRQKLDDVNRWQQEWQHNAQQLDSLAHRAALLQLRLDDHARQAERRRERTQAHEQAQARVADAATALARAETLARTAQQQEQRLSARLTSLEQRFEHHRLQREHDQLQDALQRAAQTLQQAEAADATNRQLREQLAAVAIDADGVKALRDLARQRDNLALQWQQSVTRLDFDLPTGGVALDGEALSGHDSRELSQPATLRLAGGGELRIIPGNADLTTLRSRSQALDTHWRQQLEALGVRDLASAERRLERSHALGEELRHHERLLRSLAPEGLSRLQDHQATLQGRLRPLADQLGQLATVATEAADAPVADLAPLRAESLAARQAREQAETLWRTAEQTLALARHAAQAAEQEWQRERAQAATVTDEQLAGWRADWQAATAEQQRLTQVQSDGQARIDAARPDMLKQDAERLERSARLLEERFQAREVEIADLQGHLRAEQAEGLDEAIAELQGRCEQRQRHLDQLQRRARALTLLHERLSAHRTASIQALQAPLQQYLRHYLHLLFPDAALHLDEQLIPTHLERADLNEGALGELDALSFGAREQLGLITRLAYADLLREAGHPTLIVLDDVLTHADSARLGTMKRVLYDAASRHQILLFTCHPEVWQDLGVAPRALPSP